MRVSGFDSEIRDRLAGIGGDAIAIAEFAIPENIAPEDRIAVLLSGRFSESLDSRLSQVDLMVGTVKDALAYCPLVPDMGYPAVECLLALGVKRVILRDSKGCIWRGEGRRISGCGPSDKSLIDIFISALREEVASR